MTKQKIKVGVRDNRLGRILGEQVLELLRPHLGSAVLSIVPVGNSSGRGHGHALRWPGAALERALAEGEVDIAVQNMKDASPDPPPAIVLAAVTERFTPFDVLIARDGTIVDELPEGSAVSAHTPTVRVTFAQPSAAKAADCSWRTSTMSIPSARQPSYMENRCPPESVKRWLTPLLLSTFATTRPPWSIAPRA